MQRTPIVLAALFLVVIAPGCGGAGLGGTDAGLCRTACSENAQCDFGNVCRNQCCQAGCDTNDDCAGGTSCQAGRCAAVAGSRDGGGTPIDVPVGSACADDFACGPGGHCATELPGGYCTLDCTSTACPSGSGCFSVGNNQSLCFQTCTNLSECRASEGYICDADQTCYPGAADGGAASDGGAVRDGGAASDGGTAARDGGIALDGGVARDGGSVADGGVASDGGVAGIREIGAACTAASQCAGGACMGLPGGYCTMMGCSTSSPCPSGSECFGLNPSGSACFKSCTAPAQCRVSDGYTCDTDNTCYPGVPAPDGGPPSDGGAVTLPAGPGAGPGPSCANLPPMRCTSGAATCNALTSFSPRTGVGYEDYPLNGETTTNQYRSFLRRDLIMLLQYAAAKLACKAASWTTGNGGLVGLGDMSEQNGAIPGTSLGDPGHPAGTHVNGFDIDVGYLQLGTADNQLRPICPHTTGIQDAYHCTGAPTSLDVWRSAAFLGFVFEHEKVRVVGVDGRAGALIDAALDKLCQDGWLTAAACRQRKLTYELTDMGRGWFLFHHHHMHISFSQPAYKPGSGPSSPADECLVPGCDPGVLDTFRRGYHLPSAALFSPADLSKRAGWRLVPPSWLVPQPQ